MRRPLYEALVKSLTRATENFTASKPPEVLQLVVPPTLIAIAYDVIE